MGTRAKITICWAACVCIAYTLYAQKPARQLREYDFGTVHASALLQHTFFFKEEVVSVLSFCDCLSASAAQSAQGWKVSLSIHAEDMANGPKEAVIKMKSGKLIRLRLYAEVKEDEIR